MYIKSINNEKGIDSVINGEVLKQLQQKHESKDVDNNLCKTCFLIDARIQDIWTNTVSYLLYKKRDEDSTFYQTEFENLLNFFNGNSFNKDTYKKIISTIS